MSVMKKVMFALLLIPILGYSQLSIKKATGQNKANQIDQLMNKYAEYGQFNGSVLVAEKGKIIYKKGFGMANREWNIPNESDTKHLLASITKQFTSMLILQLMEKDKLRLDDPISAYLPDYPKLNGDKITIHHLLSNASGIPNYTSFPNFFEKMGRNPFDLKEMIKTFADSTLQFKPGEKFAYSNSGFIVLGAIIEKVTGKKYEECLQEYILNPLKMHNTGYNHQETVLKNRSSGYEMNGKVYTNAKFSDAYAAGALYSTAEDLYLWDQALYSDQLISSKSRDLLFGRHVQIDTGKYYGYGWFINENSDKTKTVEHSGGIFGYNILISRVPTDKHLVVLLNNTRGNGLSETNLYQISETIRAILYGKSYSLPKKSMAYALFEKIDEADSKTVFQKLAELKKDNSYEIRESEMNLIGYQLLRSGKVKESIDVFKLNVETFPKSANCYDSLGEAYLTNGEKELAIINYKKCVELSPENENGKKMLEKLLK
jgi:CubicO group peptidase (beta-lactamase class C family)